MELLCKGEIIKHIYGLGGVSSEMKLVPNQSRICVGLIDNDKAQNSDYFRDNFDVEKSGNGVIYKVHKKVKHHLIYLSKDMESWVLNKANEIGVSVEKYGFPNDANLLKKRYTQKESIMNNPKFKEFLNAIKQKGGFVELEGILEGL